MLHKMIVQEKEQSENLQILTKSIKFFTPLLFTSLENL